MYKIHALRKPAAMLLCLLLLSLSLCIYAAPADSADGRDATAAYLLSALPSPAPGDIGGDWVVLGLKQSGISLPDGYTAAYLAQLEQELAAADGIFNGRKYTAYSRTILTLSALGEDPYTAAGFNFVKKLGEFDSVMRQGVNGSIYALMALDSLQAPAPQEWTDTYLKAILDAQNPDGGFGLSPGVSETDLTAMSLQALAGHMDRRDVKAAVCTALRYLSAALQTDGAFSSYGVANAESAAQVILGLHAVGIPLTDSRFILDGQTALDQLNQFRCESGGYRHTAGTDENLMATQQALLALNAAAEPVAEPVPNTLLEYMIFAPDAEIQYN